MKRTRIAIICQNDTLWSLYAWNKALPLLAASKDEFELTGFWICDEKMLNLKKNEVWKWYLNVFKPFNFLLLSIFAVFFKIVTSFKSVTTGYSTSFIKLCKQYNIPTYSTSSPNNKEFSDWLKANEIDVLVIMVGHILKGEILNAPANCIINKHAAMLPANKGVFPYFWAYINGQQQGVSFHKVTSKIDEGDILYQERVEGKKWTSSMISFYFRVYSDFGQMLLKALAKAKNNTIAEPNKANAASYYGAPTESDYYKFRKLKGKIITIGDLFLPLHI